MQGAVDQQQDLQIHTVRYRQPMEFLQHWCYGVMFGYFLEVSECNTGFTSKVLRRSELLLARYYAGGRHY